MSKAEPNEVIYRVSPGESKFTVQAFAEGWFSAFGHDPKLSAGDFGGQVRMPEGKLEAASLLLTVKADSLRVIDDISEKDRREIERAVREEVLETSLFPAIVFKGTAVSLDRIYEGLYRLMIVGELSLHGVTREHSVDTQVRLLENSLRAEGASSLRQSNYGIKRVSVAGGMLRVKDEVKLSFSIVAQAERESAQAPQRVEKIAGV